MYLRVVNICLIVVGGNATNTFIKFTLTSRIHVDNVHGANLIISVHIYSADIKMIEGKNMFSLLFSFRH